MKERPILFSARLVRAILERRKTQTRRVAKPQPAALCRYEMNASGNAALHLGPPAEPGHSYSFVPPTAHSRDHRLPCPYGAAGDRLWVRESHAFVPWTAGAEQRGEEPDVGVRYRATWDRCHSSRWRPSIHMPRWASRIELDVAGVRVERIQDITEADAKAEGVTEGPDGIFWGRWTEDNEQNHFVTAREAFADLWDDLNERRGFGWKANPWVWVVSFPLLPVTHGVTETGPILTNQVHR